MRRRKERTLGLSDSKGLTLDKCQKFLRYNKKLFNVYIQQFYIFSYLYQCILYSKRLKRERCFADLAIERMLQKQREFDKVIIEGEKEEEHIK